jgi:Peptidase C10 family/Spi protease inhibitor
VFLLFLVSCQKNVETNVIKFKGQLGIVPSETATYIAKNFIKMYYGNLENRDIEEQESVSENGSPLFYIFNYKNGGFLILSAENGEMPILATGLENKFPLKGETNPGIGIWLTDTRDRIVAIRTGKTPPKAFAAKMWQDLTKHTYKSTFEILSPRNINAPDLRKVAPDDPDCSTLPYITTQINPLLNTTWGQGEGYNNECPVFANGPGGHAPTGCVATATAQIMKFHNFPSTSNFGLSNMPLNSGNTFTAILMHTIGVNVNMDYTATGSSAFTSNVEGFLELIGYSTDANYGTYIPSTAVDNIAIGRPVIFDGCNNQFCFLGWCWGTSPCHAWVADGFIQTIDPCYGTFLMFHMNWGWSGFGPNAYYFSPAPADFDRNYQYGRKMLYNIHH